MDPRNRAWLEGTVVEVNLGAPKSSASEKGDKVTVVIKSTEVMLQKD